MYTHAQPQDTACAGAVLSLPLLYHRCRNMLSVPATFTLHTFACMAYLLGDHIAHKTYANRRTYQFRSIPLRHGCSRAQLYQVARLVRPQSVGHRPQRFPLYIHMCLNPCPPCPVSALGLFVVWRVPPGKQSRRVSRWLELLPSRWASSGSPRLVLGTQLEVHPPRNRTRAHRLSPSFFPVTLV